MCTATKIINCANLFRSWSPKSTTPVGCISSAFRRAVARSFRLLRTRYFICHQSYWQSVSRSHSHPIAKKILRCPRHIVVPSFDPLRNLKDSARALVACVLVNLSSIFRPSPVSQSSYRFALVSRVIQCSNRICQKRGGMYFSLCRRVCATYYQQQHHVMGVEYTMIAI